MQWRNRRLIKILQNPVRILWSAVTVVLKGRIRQPDVPFVAGVLGAVAALRGASSSSDEPSEEPLLSSAFAAGGVLTVLTGFAGLLLASSSELLSLDEDSLFVAGFFAVVEAALPLVTG